MKSSKKDSTLFLLPLLGLSKNIIFNKHFVTTYIRDYRFPELDNVVILEYKKSNPELDEMYSYGKTEGEGYVLYYYQVDKYFEQDYLNFIEGKYSRFSNKAKQEILSFWGSNKVSLIYGILYKTDYARVLYLNSLHNRGIDTSKTNFEYWRIPNLTKETWKNLN